MDKNVIKIISRFRKVLESNGTKIDKIMLYGSYARNSQHEGSDIDLVVISKDFKGKSSWHRIKILSKAVYEVYEPIEALAYTPEEWEKSDSIICSIVKESGVLV